VSIEGFTTIIKEIFKSRQLWNYQSI
jgi:hypothetical protein